MNARLGSFLSSADEWLCRNYVGSCTERNALIIVNFHKLLLDEQERKLELMDSLNETTLDDFRRFIEYFLANKYEFVSPQEILAGLESDKRYVSITFDDGYFNNHRALPILKEYEVPATLMVSSNYVRERKAFWWDVIFREGRKRGASDESISLEQSRLKFLSHKAIDDYIRVTFGEKAFKPVSDLDRPFTPNELRDFSNQDYVSLGNHTSNHAFLPSYPDEGVNSEILDAQNDIREMTGVMPDIIAYPYGAYSDEILTIAKNLGFRLGFIGEKEKNRLPIRFDGNRPLRLRRFTLRGNRNIEDQCELYRSDIQLLATARRIKKSLGLSNP